LAFFLAILPSSLLFPERNFASGEAASNGFNSIKLSQALQGFSQYEK
jgi:hypothetical protein